MAVILTESFVHFTEHMYHIEGEILFYLTAISVNLMEMFLQKNIEIKVREAKIQTN